MVFTDIIWFYSGFQKAKSVSANIPFFKSVLLRQQFCKTFQNSFSAHFRFSVVMCVRILKIYFRLIFKLKKVKREVKYFVFCSETAPDMRRYHVAKYTGAEAQQIHVIKKNELVYQQFSLLTYFKSVSLLFSFLFSFSVNSFKRSKYDSSWLTQSFQECLQVIFLQHNDNNFYFYLSLTSSAYYSAYFSSEVLKKKTSFISSNSPMYRPMRYSYLPNATIELCSQYQLEEIKPYLENKWAVCRTVELWGLEEEIDIDKVFNKDVKYDIIIFSSAEWARNEQYWREQDLEKIRALVPTKLFIYKIFDEMILDTVIELKQEFSHLKIILLPHPYERELIKKRALIPPYMSKITGAGIEFESEGRNSVSLMGNGKIAIAECSTIIFDCWHMDIPAFTFSGKGYEGKFNVDYKYEYLGEYKKYCFSTKTELKQRIKDLICVA